jgi:hypothetical protein
MFVSQEALEACLKTGWIACQDLHEHDCLTNSLIHFGNTFSSMGRMYLPIHLIPLLLKLGKLRKEPLKYGLRTVRNWLKSVCFAATYCLLLSVYLCYSKNLCRRTSGTSGLLTREPHRGGLLLGHEPALGGARQEGLGRTLPGPQGHGNRSPLRTQTRLGPA